MLIRFRCPECSTALEIEPTQGGVVEKPCPSCAKNNRLDFTEAIHGRQVIDRCPLCGCLHLYVQKDFNQKIGLGIVILAGTIGLIFVAMDRPIGFYLSLLTAVVVDALLYWLLPKITICYRCKTEFRDFNANPEHGPFDLKVADVYDRKEKGR